MKVTDVNSMNRKLTKIAREFLMEAYGLELLVPVRVNGRLKSVFGRFICRRGRKIPIAIEISKNYIEHQEWTTVIETLKHECIHYALYMLDKPYKDGTEVFEKEIAKHQSHSTGVIAYKGKVVVYECPSCKASWNRKRRFPRNGDGYTCAKCKVQIKFMGEKII